MMCEPRLTVAFFLVASFAACGSPNDRLLGDATDDGGPTMDVSPAQDGSDDLPLVDAPGVPDASSVTTAPRLIGPLSTSRVTSRRPTLHWSLQAGLDGAHVQLCRDR